MSNLLKRVRRAHTKREAHKLVKAKEFVEINVGKVEKLRKQLSRPELAGLVARLLAVPKADVPATLAGMSIPHLTRLWASVKEFSLQLYKEQQAAKARQAARVDATLAPEKIESPLPAG